MINLKQWTIFDEFEILLWLFLWILNQRLILQNCIHNTFETHRKSIAILHKAKTQHKERIRKQLKIVSICSFPNKECFTNAYFDQWRNSACKIFYYLYMRFSIDRVNVFFLWFLLKIQFKREKKTTFVLFCFALIRM